MIAVGFDQNSKGDLVRFDLFRHHEVVDLEGLGDVAIHDAHVHDAVVEHAVHFNVVGLQFVQPSEDLHIRLAGGDVAGLLFHALDHSGVGVLVCGESTCSHLLKERTSQFVLVEVDTQIYQSIVGLLARLESVFLHLFDQFQRGSQVLGVGVSLQQDVLGDEVWLLVYVGFRAEFCEQFKRLLHVLHQDAALQQTIEHDCGAHLQFVSALVEQLDNAVEPLVGVGSLDASAEGGNGEVVRVDGELDHGVQHVPCFAGVPGADQAVDNGVLADHGQGEATGVHEVEDFLHFSDFVVFAASIEHYVKDGLVEVKEFFSDLPEEADGLFHHAYLAHGSDHYVVGLFVRPAASEFVLLVQTELHSGF